MSVRFYDENAEAFFAGTVNADMSGARSRFLANVALKGHILDAGCGSGRDALAFTNSGFRVTAFDASAEMVRLAADHTHLPILHMTFEEVAWDGEFDGVWASASLLHVPRANLARAIAALAKALRPGGTFYVSMKQGDEERSVEGRLFTDVSEEEMSQLLQAAGLAIVELWISADVRPGRGDEHWVNGIAQKRA
ncbi:methyltransferase domain-containing protein [Erythrobacter arachoides]|uniref:Methyltransferase domain-containing protein n=1 Tax=Aurantiacibacter arachoides TaxID=1850444 RepID=A0A845A4K1_9SPHN|nr:class I SAM-dependent methyltransferase [Aurantiacibacter arachoides]MXO94076.1 methyltransferase domain-containing protein [Aurantiacibacter arachoides]GGD66226.1 SAM-dependent methyltransferase [Aurantiacibacter arachoides]